MISLLATAIASSTPLVFAVLGETLSERAGVINLSAEGTILLAAMTGFAAAKHSGSVLMGFMAAAGIGALVAFVVAVASITLKQSQVAIGFVLALLCADLSSFLGTPVVRVPGPTVPSFRLPILQHIPVVGELLFRSDGLVYCSFLLIAFMWVFIYRTGAGLTLRAIGEQPAAAFARGINVVKLRYVYTLVGGSLMGIAGAAYSLDFRAGWSHRHTAGYGWIALAIAIFGGWNPLRAALGVYLFGLLQALANTMQGQLPGIPTQLFSVAPFVLMIGVLAVTSSDWLERLLMPLPPIARRKMMRFLKVRAPAGLGKVFEQG
ncbi:MAG: ABC transporter permease [Cyanobacteria bacterium P01_E01_bin.34]